MAELTANKRWAARLTTWPPVLIVLGCILTTVLDTQRVQDRFSKDWKIPWPESSCEWFYASPPLIKLPGSAEFRQGKSFLIITTPARDEVFLVLDFQD